MLVSIRGFNCTGTTGVNVDVNQCSSVELIYMRLIAGSSATANFMGVHCRGCYMIAMGEVQISNKAQAIYMHQGLMYIHTISGSGNNLVLIASEASTIGRGLSMTIAGTTATLISNGGQIR